MIWLMTKYDELCEVAVSNYGLVTAKEIDALGIHLKRCIGVDQARADGKKGPSAIAFKRSDADFDFPQRKVHDLELQVLEVA